MKYISALAAEDEKSFSQLLFILLFFLGVLIYVPALFMNYFHYDDKLTILFNPDIRDLFDIQGIWRSFNSRFIVGLTFAFNYWLTGDNHFSFHFFNVFLHVLSSLILYKFVIALLQARNVFSKLDMKNKRFLAAFSSFIFLVHPVQSEAINFITQRYAVMATFFYLVAVYLYTLAALRKSIGFYLASLFSVILAMLSKEISATAPIMILIIELLFFGSSDLKKKFVKLSPFLLTLVIIPAILVNTSTQTFPSARVAGISMQRMDHYSSEERSKVDITRAGGAQFSRLEYMIIQINVIRTYLRLLLFPVCQNIDYDYPHSLSILQPKTLLSILLIVSLLLIAYLVHRVCRLLSFSIIWFFLSLSVESSIIPIAHVIAEYRLYLPMIGFAIFLPCFLNIIIRDRVRYFKMSTFITVILAFMTFNRNIVWQDEARIWEDTARKSPYKARPHINLGITYLERKMYNKAILSSQKAIKLAPNNHLPYVTLAQAYFTLGELKKAETLYLKSIQLNSNYGIAYYGMGRIFESRKELDKAIDYYIKAIQIDHYNHLAHLSLGVAYAKKGEYKKTMEQIIKLEELKQFQLADRLKFYINLKLKLK